MPADDKPGGLPAPTLMVRGPLPAATGFGAVETLRRQRPVSAPQRREGVLAGV